MKLLVVTPYFYPKMGGLENYAYKFSIGLKNIYKWDIVVVTSNHKAKKDTVEKINGLKVYRLAPLFKLSNTPINPMWYWKIKKIIAYEKPNVINAHTPVPFIADMASLAKKRIPFIVTYHAFSIKKENFTILNLIIGIYKIFEYFLFKKADKIIIVSDVIKNAIPKKFSNKVITIYNSLSSKEIARKKSLIKTKETSLAFISSLDKSHVWKGLDEILLAIKLLPGDTQKQIKLNVVGDGNDKKRYQHLAKQYNIEKLVSFFGKKDGNEKNKILQKTSIGIIYPKSSNDAFPTVALEYWAHSLPLIVSNITPINNIFSNKRTALFVEPKNASALAKAILKLMTDRSLFQKLAEKGRTELLTKYILESETKKFNALLKGISI